MAVPPFDQRDGVIWMNGAMVPWADARLHVLSHGLHYASSVFEGERAYGGVIFKSTEHSERLLNSGRILDMAIPYSVGELDRIKAEVVAANHQTDCYVRPVAWRGSEMMAVAAQNATIHVAIATWDWPSHVRHGDQDERHQARHRRVPPSRSGDGALPRPRRRAST